MQYTILLYSVDKLQTQILNKINVKSNDVLIYFYTYQSWSNSESHHVSMGKNMYQLKLRVVMSSKYPDSVLVVSRNPRVTSFRMSQHLTLTSLKICTRKLPAIKSK